MSRGRIEVILHVIFGLLMLSSLNIQWSSNWFDPSIRPKSPAPLSVVVLFLYFYVNAFYLIPKYFDLATWKQYIAAAFLLFILPELIRIACYQVFIEPIGFEKELFSRDSFLLGAPSAFFIGINSSFIYRLTLDWFISKRKIKTLQNQANETPVSVPYEGSELLTEEEISILKPALLNQLEVKKLYLNPEITLKDLASAIGSTEKKTSYLINQKLDTNFYELINTYRVDAFKANIAKPENEALSLVGVALNCGFPSKSSFYRAFKAQTSMSPSQYLKSTKTQ